MALFTRSGCGKWKNKYNHRLNLVFMDGRKNKSLVLKLKFAQKGDSLQVKRANRYIYKISLHLAVEKP